MSISTETSDLYARLVPNESAESPFRYFLSKQCFKPWFESALLSWLENDAPWKLVRADFYEQYEFDLLNVALPPELLPAISPEALVQLRRKMEIALGDPLEDETHVIAHRLEPGQRIAIHNDVRKGGETHRLTVQLNRGLGDEDGGLFVLFNSDDPSDIHRLLRPISGSAIGFAIGPTSHHAVSQVLGGTRYTLVYSFYARRQP